MTDCTKIPYPTPADAKRNAIRIVTRYRKRGAKRFPRGVHPCARCHAWHITSHRTNAKYRIGPP